MMSYKIPYKGLRIGLEWTLKPPKELNASAAEQLLLEAKGLADESLKAAGKGDSKQLALRTSLQREAPCCLHNIYIDHIS